MKNIGRKENRKYYLYYYLTNFSIKKNEFLTLCFDIKNLGKVLFIGHYILSKIQNLLPL